MYAFLLLSDRQTLPQTRACVYFFRSLFLVILQVTSARCMCMRCISEVDFVALDVRARLARTATYEFIYTIRVFLACLLCLLVRLLLAYKELENVA